MTNALYGYHQTILKDDILTILKNLFLSLALTSLAASVAFAAGGNDPIKDIDIIVKDRSNFQATVKQPTSAQEHRIIRQKVVKPMALPKITRINRKEKIVSR